MKRRLEVIVVAVEERNANRSFEPCGIAVYRDSIAKRIDHSRVCLNSKYAAGISDLEVLIGNKFRIAVRTINKLPGDTWCLEVVNVRFRVGSISQVIYEIPVRSFARAVC